MPSGKNKLEAAISALDIYGKEVKFTFKGRD